MVYYCFDHLYTQSMYWLWLWWAEEKNFIYKAAVIQWIILRLKNHMTTGVITLWHVHITSLIPWLSTVRLFKYTGMHYRVIVKTAMANILNCLVNEQVLYMYLHGQAVYFEMSALYLFIFHFLNQLYLLQFHFHIQISFL